MRRRLVIWLIPLGLAALAACSSSSPAATSSPATTSPATTGTTTSPAPQGGHRAAVHVRPSTGGPQSTFVVTFKAPQAAGASGIRATSYQIAAIGRQATGCQAFARKAIRNASKGQHERVRLAPRTQGWCRGTFHGVVEFISGPNCTKGQVCPEFVSVVATVGRFTFHVS